MEPAYKPSGADLDALVLVQALPLAAVLIGADGDILAASNTAADVFGNQPCQKFNDLALPSDVPAVRAALDSARRRGTPVNVAGIRRVRAGRGVYVDLTMTPVRAGSENGPVLITAIDRSDVFETHHAYERLRAEHGALSAQCQVSDDELRALNDELSITNEHLRQHVQELEAAEQADARKNQFLAMLAHELRNPLGAAVNALHVIRRAAGSDRQIVQAARIADRQLQHEARLLDDLLDVSRIVLGKVAVQTRPVDVCDCVRTAAEGASFAMQARALALSVSVPDHPLIVNGDVTRLEQCFGNLLSNAVKFTPPAGVVSIRAHADEDDAVVTVTDSGAGIAPEMLDRVFDLFVQADSSLGRTQGGLGIGLTLVRHLVERHGGAVVARSAGPGHGSEFEIRIPLARADMPHSAPEPSPSGRPRRILVVEDNRDAREMLRTLLELQGHVVSDAGDGAAAVRQAVDQVPDVVLLDIGLPDVDGFETGRRIQRRLGAQVRLVALSGYGDEEARQRGREAGFDAHLVKPVSPDALVRAIAAL